MSIGRSLVLLLVTATALAGAVAIGYGVHDGAAVWAGLAAVGAAVLGLAHALARRRPRLGSLRRQFTVGVAIAVGQLVVLAAAAAQLMFVSAHDALLLMVIVVFAGVVAVRAAQLFAATAMRDVETLRDTLVAVGEGSRAPVAVTGSADELAELGRAVNTAIAKLDGAEAVQRDLIAAVSHDLRTPITSLRLLAEAVGDDIVDAPTRRGYLEQMSTHIQVLSALIDDLFELSRLEAGDIQWTLQQVPLGQLVEEAVDALRPQAEAKGVSVRADVRAHEPARANPEKVQRVLFNLIQNAIRHTPADGSVTVLAEAADGRVEIEVADTGDGIGDDDRGRVFEPFYRGGSEAARTRAGAGLGLAISRAIVEAHGGRIWLADSPSGTRVRFSLPRS
ncbi:MAG: HAMP domain-containing sensor histidine kinase [Solirubrobacteraceae bacterium]